MATTEALPAPARAPSATRRTTTNRLAIDAIDPNPNFDPRTAHLHRNALRAKLFRLYAPPPPPPRMRAFAGAVVREGQSIMPRSAQSDVAVEPPKVVEPEPQEPPIQQPDPLRNRLSLVRDVITAVREEMLRLDPPIEVTEFGFFNFNRIHKNVMARHIAIYVVKQITTSSLPEIGRRIRAASPMRLGLSTKPMDHTSVLHAIRRIETKRKSNPIVKQLIDNVMARFAPAPEMVEPAVEA